MVSSLSEDACRIYLNQMAGEGYGYDFDILAPMSL